MLNVATCCYNLQRAPFWGLKGTGHTSPTTFAMAGPTSLQMVTQAQRREGLA